MNETYTLIKLCCGALATFGLYSVLYKENRMYRFFEHVFLGLASGYALVVLWAEVLKNNWYDKMIGTAANGADPGTMGYWPFAAIIPIAFMGYLVFNKKHNWISRIPIGIILGLFSGQQFQAWQNRYVEQISDSMRPVIPTTSQFFKPALDGLSKADAAAVKANLYGSQALNNLIFVITLTSVLSYFLFSFDVKSKVLNGLSTTGRWLLMVGFGAIFGSTVMMRFTLLIDRMYFIWFDVFARLLHR